MSFSNFSGTIQDSILCNNSLPLGYQIFVSPIFAKTIAQSYWKRKLMSVCTQYVYSYPISKKTSQYIISSVAVHLKPSLEFMHNMWTSSSLKPRNIVFPLNSKLNICVFNLSHSYLKLSGVFSYLSWNTVEKN